MFFGSKEASRLLNHHIYFVPVFHLQRLRRVIVLDPLPIENKPTLVVTEPLSLTVGVHQLFQLRALFYLEENFGAVLRLHLNIELFGAWCCCWRGFCYALGGDGAVGLAVLLCWQLVGCVFHAFFIIVGPLPS